MIVRTYDDEDFRVHTVPLIGMSTVVVLTLALVISTQLGFFDRQGVPENVRAERGVTLVETRQIKFNDTADGSVQVVDATTGEELGLYAQGEGGFVRATARAMVHNRIQHGIGSQVPFELITWDSGDMTLRDTQTGRAVELSAFGTKTYVIYQDIMAKGRE